MQNRGLDYMAINLFHKQYRHLLSFMSLSYFFLLFQAWRKQISSDAAKFSWILMVL